MELYLSFFKLFKHKNIINIKSIVFLIPHNKPAGATFVIYEYALRLKKIGWKVLILSLTSPKKIDQAYFSSLKVEKFGLKFMSLLSQSLVIATSWNTALYLPFLPASKKYYYVQTNENNFVPNGNNIGLFVDYSYKLDFPIITSARWLKSWLKSTYNKDAKYIPNGLNHDLFYQVNSLKPKSPYKLRILIEGTAKLPSKRIAESFSITNQLDVEVWYVSYDSFLDKNWRIDKFFHGVKYEDMKNIYSSCDILLKLSTAEGFFAPPLEMMACGGLPIVHPVTGSEEYIKNGENAFVLNYKNTEEIIRIIEKLNKNRDYLEKLKINALNSAKKIDWEKSANLFDSYLIMSLTISLNS